MRLDQVAVQFYTVRDFCRTASDLAATARKVRALGYPAVQLSGVGPIDDDEIARIMRGEGLVVCATHEPAAHIRTKPERVVDRLRLLGCRHAAFPFPTGVDVSRREQIDLLIADLERAGAVLAQAGLTLSYHNHAIEFVRVDGRTLLETIFAGTSPQHLAAELDTYWVQYGGGDPLAWCERLAGRLPLIHLKDYGYTAENKPAFAEIGRGNLDFRRIIAAAEKSGCEWFIVEQDTCPGDPFDSLRLSFDFIKAHLLAGS